MCPPCNTSTPIRVGCAQSPHGLLNCNGKRVRSLAGMGSPATADQANDSCCVSEARWDCRQPTERWVFCCPHATCHLVPARRQPRASSKGGCMVTNVRRGGAICIVVYPACIRTERRAEHAETKLGRPTRPTFVLCA